MPHDSYLHHVAADGGLELRDFGYPKVANAAALPVLTNAHVGTIYTTSDDGRNHQLVSSDGTTAVWDIWQPVERQYAYLKTGAGAVNPSILADVLTGKLAVGDPMAWVSYIQGANVGQGQGRIVAAGTGTDDGGQWVDLGPDGGGSVLQLQQVFDRRISLAQYGVLPGTDVQAEFTSAIGRAGALDIPLYIPEGEWFLTASVFAPVGTTTIVGEGMDRSILKTQAGLVSFDMLIFATGRSSNISGLTVDGNSANTVDPANANLGNAIFCTAGGRHRWDNVAARDNNAYGLRAQIGAAATLEVQAVNCEGTGNDVSGVIIDGGTSGSVSGGRWSNNGEYGVLVTRCSQFKVDSIVECTGNASHGITVAYSESVGVNGNDTSGNTGSGIAMGGGLVTETANRNWTVSGNTCNGNTLHGITIDPTVTTGVAEDQVGSITGNTCRNNVIHGIYVQHSIDISCSGNISCDNGTHGVQISSVINGSFTGNTFARNTGWGTNISVLNDISFDGRNVRLTGNVYDANGLGALITEAEYPDVYFDFPNSGPTAGRPPAPVLGMEWFDTDLGQRVIWDGTIWLPPFYVTPTPFTGDGTTDTFAVNHGLNTATPRAAVFVDGVEIKDGWSVSPVDADNRTVEFDTAPAIGELITVRFDA